MPANKNGSPNEVQKEIRLGFIIVLLLLLFKSENTMHTNSGTSNVNYD